VSNKKSTIRFLYRRRHHLGTCARWAIMSSALAGYVHGQGLPPTTPAQEYVNWGGKPVIIENNASGVAVPSLCTSVCAIQAPNPVGGVYTASDSNGTGFANVSADQLGFAYFSVSNDFRIVAHLKSAGSSTFAGLMIRDSLDPGAQMVYAGSQSGGNVTGWSRSAIGAQSQQFAYQSGSYPYVMMLRFGETVFIYYSADGKAWTQLGGQLRFTMQPNALVGFAVVSGGTASSSATFDSVTIDRYPPFFSLGAYMAGNYFVLQNVGTGKVMDGNSGGSSIVEWGLYDQPNQHWAPVLRSDSYFYIGYRPTNAVLTDAGSGTVTQATQNWGDAQGWSLRSSDGQSLSFINKQSGLALGFASANDLTHLAEVTFNPGDPLQRWYLRTTPGSSWDGGIITNPTAVAAATGAASVSAYLYQGQAGTGAYGLGAYQSSYNDMGQAFGGSELWQTTPPNTQTTPLMKSGIIDGEPIVLKESNLGLMVASTVFRVLSPPPFSTGVKIINKHSGLYLHWNGSQVVQTGTGTSEWTFIPTAIPGQYTIKNGSNYLSAQSSGAQSYLTLSSTPQTWQLNPTVAAASAVYELLNVNTGYVAEPSATYLATAGDPASQSGVAIWQNSLLAGDNQQWTWQ
jgi:Ricin-type beta-trefoil lectin domain-like